MKKMLAILLAAFLILGVAAACADDPPAPVQEVQEEVQAVVEEVQEEVQEVIDEVQEDVEVRRIAFSLPPIRNDFHGRMRIVIDEAIEDVLAARPGEFEFTAINANDDNHQFELFEMFISEGYDLIAVMPNDAMLMAPVVAEAYESGIPVIVINRDLPEPTYTHFIAGDNVDGGRLAAQFIGNYFDGPADIVMVRMNVGTPIGEDRHRGFMDEIVNFPHINILGEAASAPNREAGLEDMGNLLLAHPHIDAVFTHDDETAQGAIEAIRDANRTDIQIMTGFGGVLSVLESYLNDDRPWPESVLVGTALYSPFMGYDAVWLAIDVLDGVSHPHRIIQPSIFVTRDNAAEWLHLGY